MNIPALFPLRKIFTALYTREKKREFQLLFDILKEEQFYRLTKISNMSIILDPWNNIPPKSDS